ncbi:MAG: hypothetical protein KAS57_08240, partial [Gammaproteobacteria bacterium]|nr:hypothetical protein [Gammaproteobacteria bacterium]
INHMITDEQKKQIESLTTEEMRYEIILGRLPRSPHDEKYDHLKACYQLRISGNKSSESTNTKHDWYGFPLRKIAVGTISACIILVISNYFNFSA